MVFPNVTRFITTILLGLFLLVSFHTVIFEKKSTPLVQSHCVSICCATLCLASTSMNELGSLQITLNFWLSAMLLLLGWPVLVQSLTRLLSYSILSPQLMRLKQYAKQHRLVHLFSQLLELYQRGIIAPKLYA